MGREGTRERPDEAAPDDGRVRRGLRRAVRSDATAFGYSVLITATFGAVSLQVGRTTVPRLFAFVVGATLGFALLEAVASRGFQVRIREERSDVVLIGTALAPVSVSLGLGAALGVIALVGGTWAWGLAPCAATGTYVLMAGAQMAVARRYEERHPPRQEE